MWISGAPGKKKKKCLEKIHEEIRVKIFPKMGKEEKKQQQQHASSGTAESPTQDKP